MDVGKINVGLKVGLILLFLLCLVDMPYGYYQFVRFVGALSLGYLAYYEFKNDVEIFPFIWIGAALLLQPFLKISLGRTIWNIVDVLLAVLLIVSIVRSRRS